MSVLVTGGAGYIGSHMVLALVDRGEDVVVLDNLATGFDWCVSPAASLRIGDIADETLVGSILGKDRFDAIIHFAGSVVVPDSVADPLFYYANNTVKSRQLIEMAVRHGVPHFIFSSTATVYESSGDGPLVETGPLSPASPYGRSKLMTEWMLEDAARAYALDYAVLRYFNVAGADPQGRSGQSTRGATHLIKVAVEAALGRRPHVDVFGTDYPTRDGTAIRDYVHVSDLVAAHLSALDRLRSGGGSLTANIGYGRGYSVREVLDVAKRVTGADFPVRDARRRPGDPHSLVADPGRARSLLGWAPAYADLEAIVRDAFAWERHLMRRNAGPAELAGASVAEHAG